MTYQHKAGSGTAFKNDYKKEDKHPDLKGQLLLPEWAKPGMLIDIAIWSGRTNAGDAKLSFRVSEPRDKPLLDDEIKL